MVKTCHKCRSHSNHYDEARLKRCAGCQKVYYCSTACQKDDWIRHIFDCKPRRPINTADYLALAVYQNMPPEHPQTRKDYGFDRALTGEEKSMLLGLYIGLIKHMAISPKTIHDWRVRGVLVDEIKAAFYKLPEKSRGDYFSWFLENEQVVALAGQPLPEKMVEDNIVAMMERVWRFIGGSESDSSEQVRAAVFCKTGEEKECYFHYGLLLSNYRASPDLNDWVEFGYASCISREEELELGARYKELIRRCTFEEFCDAYRGRRLLDLFHSKELQIDDPRGHLRDLLHTDRKKSVWYLKQSIAEEDYTKEECGMAPSAMGDYGFINCRNDSERRQLKRVYKAFFDSPDGDPLALHDAAMEGNIHGYLSRVVKGLRDPKFERLMENSYPLLTF